MTPSFFTYDLIINKTSKILFNYFISYLYQFKLLVQCGIVAFEILITALQAKKKLSQNRTEMEKEKIIDTLSKSKDTNEQLTAAYMKRSYELTSSYCYIPKCII